jgi:predicted DNA-binding transcriptional regulator AlpA
MSAPDVGALLLSPKAAAKALGICRRSLEREIARGKFPRPLKIGSSSRFRWEDITQYLERLTRERSSALPFG